MDDRRVEHQAEVDGERTAVFALVATAEGLCRWLDGAEIDPRVGGRTRLRLRDAVATGRVLAMDEPQHVSFSWEWEGQPVSIPSVVAFDLIEHGSRTHLTVRQVGFADRRSAELHDALWRHWFPRLVAVAETVSREAPVAVG